MLFCQKKRDYFWRKNKLWVNCVSRSAYLTIFDSPKIGCGWEVEPKNMFFFVLLSPFTIFVRLIIY